MRKLSGNAGSWFGPPVFCCNCSKKSVKRPASLPGLYYIGLAAARFSASVPALVTILPTITGGGVAAVATVGISVARLHLLLQWLPHFKV